MAKALMGIRLTTDQACEVIKEYLPSVCDNSSGNGGSEDTDTE